MEKIQKFFNLLEINIYYKIISSHVVIDPDGNQFSKTARVPELANKSAVTRGDESDKLCNHSSKKESEERAENHKQHLSRP